MKKEVCSLLLVNFLKNMKNKIGKLVWFVIIILALGLLVFLNSKKTDDTSNLIPNQEQGENKIEEGVGGEEIVEEEKEVVENDLDDKVGGDKKSECESKGGEWFSGSNVCEINSLSQEQCLAEGGEFNECASACRHNPEAEMCTMQCVLTCTFR